MVEVKLIPSSSPVLNLGKVASGHKQKQTNQGQSHPDEQDNAQKSEAESVEQQHIDEIV